MFNSINSRQAGKNLYHNLAKKIKDSGVSIEEYFEKYYEDDLIKERESSDKMTLHIYNDNEAIILHDALFKIRAELYDISTFHMSDEDGYTMEDRDGVNKEILCLADWIFQLEGYINRQ